MPKRLSCEIAEKGLRNILVGGSIDRVAYYITGWELRIVQDSQPEFHLSAAEMTVPNVDDWWAGLDGLPIDLRATNEPSDTVVAVNIFTVINRWPISSISIDRTGNLLMEFANGCRLHVQAIVEMVDWTWQIDITDQCNIITCDSGQLFGNDAYFS